MWKARLYPRALPNLWGGLSEGVDNSIDFLSDTIKVAFLNSGYSYSALHEFFSDVSGDEISVSGYSSGGVTLSSKTVTYSSTNRLVTLDAADAIFSADVVEADDVRYAVIYKDTGTASTSPLMGWVDFGSVIDDDGNTNSSPQFGIKWNSDGIFTFSSRSDTNVYWFGNAFASMVGGTSSGQDRRTDWLTDDIRMALLDNTAAPNLSTAVVWADLSGDEVSGTGYTTGGQALSGKSLTLTGRRLEFDADDVDWTPVTLSSARYGIVYNATPADQPLLWIVDFEADYAPSAEDFTVSFGAGPIAVMPGA